jgi:hypothetical protein
VRGPCRRHFVDRATLVPGWQAQQNWGISGVGWMGLIGGIWLAWGRSPPLTWRHRAALAAASLFVLPVMSAAQLDLYGKERRYDGTITYVYGSGWGTHEVETVTNPSGAVFYLYAHRECWPPKNGLECLPYSSEVRVSIGPTPLTWARFSCDDCLFGKPEFIGKTARIPFKKNTTANQWMLFLRKHLNFGQKTLFLVYSWFPSFLIGQFQHSAF